MSGTRQRVRIEGERGVGGGRGRAKPSGNGFAISYESLVTE